MLTLDLPSVIERRLQQLSLNTGRTVQFYAREAILDYIDEVEERYMAMDRIAEAGMTDHYELPD